MAYETMEQRQAVYDQYAAILDNMIRGSEEHAGQGPCGAEPLCIDGQTMAGLELICAMHRDYPVLMISVAVHELATARQREIDLTIRLGAKARAYLSTCTRADAAEAEVRRLIGLINQHAHEVIEP
jgi:hypothetical protein